MFCVDGMVVLVLYNNTGSVKPVFRKTLAPILPTFAFPLTEKLFSLSLVLEKEDSVPLYPTTFFFVMILISPPIPSPSYLAEGVVITSIFAMRAQGNPLNASLIFLA